MVITTSKNLKNKSLTIENNLKKLFESINYGFIEYNVDALDEEKIEKYREYVSDVKSAERRKWICFILPLIHIILTMVMLVIGIFALLAYIEQAR